MRGMLLIVSTTLVFATGTAAQEGPDKKQGSPQEQRSPEQKTIEEAIADATLRVSELVNVVASQSALETLPGSAYLLHGEELQRQKQGFDDVHRMLRQVPGVVIQEEDGYGLRPNIGMRGSGSERSSTITLMEDGVLIAPAPYAAPSAYYFPVTGRMTAIEIRKGSSQIKFGPRTNGGVLNFLSTPVPTHLGLNADFAFGEDHTLKGHVNVGDSHKNVGWMFETYQLRTNGFKELDGGDRTGFYVQDYLGKIRFNTSPQSSTFQSLELKIGAGKEDSDETYLGLTGEDFAANPVRRYAASQRDNITWDHQQYQVQHFLTLQSGFDLTTTVYRNNFARNWYKLQSVLGTELGSIFDDPDQNARELDIARGATSAPDALKVRANNREYYSQGVQSVAGFSLETGDVGHDIEVGFRYHGDQEDRFQHEDGFQMAEGRMNLTSSGAPGSQTNRVSDASAFAIFAQDKIELSRVSILPGFRYESIDLTRTDYSTTDPNRTEPTDIRETPVSAFIPGVGITYSARPGMNLFGGVHKGFSPPGPGAGQFTKPEESINYELGLRGRKSSLGADVVFFYNDYSNLLGADTLSSGGSGEGDLFNGGAARATGLEVFFSYKIAEGSSGRLRLPLQVSYTLTDAEFLTSFRSEFEEWGEVEKGDKLPYLPRHQLYASVAVEDARWLAGFNAHYNSRMRTTAGQGTILAAEGTDSFFVVNLFGEVDLGKNIRAFANLQNLTDASYIVARRPAGARPGLPRTLMMGVKLRVR